MIRVLVVDDHDLVRHCICQTLLQSSDIEVIGQAGSGEDAVQLVRELKPDVVLMDVKMPGIGGVGAMRALRERQDPVRIIALSACESGKLPRMMVEAGVSGYLTKGARHDEMVDAVRRVAAGRTYFSPDIAGVLLETSQAAGQGNPFNMLSGREFDAVMLTIQGLSTQQIADRLFVAPKTVHTYRSRAFEKLGVRSDVELTLLAVREGLVDADGNEGGDS